jgi:hypothetical protein
LNNNINNNIFIFIKKKLIMIIDIILFVCFDIVFSIILKYKMYPHMDNYVYLLEVLGLSFYIFIILIIVKYLILSSL